MSPAEVLDHRRAAHRPAGKESMSELSGLSERRATQPAGQRTREGDPTSLNQTLVLLQRTFELLATRRRLDMGGETSQATHENYTIREGGQNFTEAARLAAAEVNGVH